MAEPTMLHPSVGWVASGKSCWAWCRDQSEPCGGPAGYELVVDGMLLAELCGDCAQLAEQGIREGSMGVGGERIGADRALIKSLPVTTSSEARVWILCPDCRGTGAPEA